MAIDDYFDPPTDTRASKSLAARRALVQKDLERLDRRRSALEDELERLTEIPTEDPYLDGTILRITLTHQGDQEYTYAALRAGGGRWYLTGRFNGWVDWPTLVRWLIKMGVFQVEVMESEGKTRIGEQPPAGEFVHFHLEACDTGGSHDEHLWTADKPYVQGLVYCSGRNQPKPKQCPNRHIHPVHTWREEWPNDPNIYQCEGV